MTYGLVEAEEEEGFEVMVADAVSKPRAVMIHLGHTNSAYTAMMSSLWLPIAALLAVQVLIGRGRLWDHLRSLKCCDSVRKQCHENEVVKEHFN